METMLLKLILEGIALLWLVYNIVRIFSSTLNAVEVVADVECKCPQSFAFKTYMKIREFYLDLSPGHRKYKIIGKNLLDDMVIDIWETAGFQFVKHKYRVVELIPNECMKLVSEQSQVKVMGVFKGTSRSEVEFRFSSTGMNNSNLGLTISNSVS